MLVQPFLAAAEEEPSRVWARAPTHARTLEASRARILSSAEALARMGLPHKALVGLVVASGPAALEALAALWCADLVPILIDPAVPKGAEAQVARGLGASHAWRVSAGWEAEPALAGLEALAPAAPRRLPDAAAVKLTSGSSGAPHGVQVSAAALRADTDALVRAFELGPREQGLAILPLSHSYGFSVLALPALTHGLTLAFPGEAGVLAAARDLGATFLPSVPAWFRSILRAEPGELPPSLRLLVSAGAPLAPDVAREFRARFGRAIHVLYGASECGSIAYDRTGTAAERGTVGTLLEGVELLLEPVEERGDGAGLVGVRSPALGLGYVPEEGGDRARLDGTRFQSEDLARWRDGELELCGRVSDWINVKGRKVDPRVVEAALAAHPRVREVVVVAKTQLETSDQVVRAVIVRAGELDYMELVEWCRPRLAPYQVPRSVVFVEELPRNERGKLDRARLLAL